MSSWLDRLARVFRILRAVRRAAALGYQHSFISLAITCRDWKRTKKRFINKEGMPSFGALKMIYTCSPFCDPDGTKDLTQPIERKKREKKRKKKGKYFLFNNSLNTFYLWLYGVRHMVKDHLDSERGNLLPPHGLLYPISNKGSFICTIPQPLLHQLWSTGWNEK